MQARTHRFVMWKNKINILFGIDTLAPMLALALVCAILASAASE